MRWFWNLRRLGSGTGVWPGYWEVAFDAMFALAVLATLGISAAEDWSRVIYVTGILLIALLMMVSRLSDASLACQFQVGMLSWGVPLLSLVIWGYCQLAAGSSENPGATLQEATKNTALTATFLISAWALQSKGARTTFLYRFAWFGFAVSVIAVSAYYTSPGKLLWLFPSPYPDIWGPFYSRNDFTAFLELCFPAAFWLAMAKRNGNPKVPLWIPAWMLAAGLASSSRAGAVVLLAEALFFLAFCTKRVSGRFLFTAALLAALLGTATLRARFNERDPLLYRREIALSAVGMIMERPWTGFGLGSFPRIYPSYARFDSGARVDHAHNDWLEWAVEGGIGYTLAWLWLSGQAIAVAFRHPWGIGIAGLTLHSLVDYPHARTGITAWLFILIGALCAVRFEKTRGIQALHFQQIQGEH